MDWLKDGAMEEDNGFGLGSGCVMEVIDVAIGAQAADDFGTWRGINGLALRTDGNFTVVAERGLWFVGSRQRATKDRQEPGAKRNVFG